MGVKEGNQEWPGENDWNIESIDVRPLLESGREPLPFILEAIGRLEAGRMLRLKAPFNPVPLYALMASRGYGARSRKRPDEGEGPFWEVLFYPLEESAGTEETPHGCDSAEAEAEGEGLLEIDLRADSVAEGIGRIEAALERLRYDDVLLVRHDHDPSAFLSHLDPTAFSHRQEAGNRALLRIWRKC